MGLSLEVNKVSKDTLLGEVILTKNVSFTSLGPSLKSKSLLSGGANLFPLTLLYSEQKCP